MNPDPTKATPQEWLEHSGWLRKLARGLVGDDTADDLVQQTWFAALRNPPERGRPARPWLARVLRNFALQQRRSESIRAQHELRAPVSTSSPSTADVVGRLETQRMLVDALLRVHEPYRATIVRHYFDGESSADIARELGVPAATMRWRLMRGLELLRIELDRDAKGKRSTWMLALVPLAGSTTPGAPLAPAIIPSIGGALAMQIGTKLAIAGALLLILLAGAWWFTGARSNATSSNLAPTAASVVATEELKFQTIAASEDERSRSTAAQIAVAGGVVGQHPLARVEGRIVDEHRKAIPAARVRISNWTGVPTSVTDEHGRFTLQLAQRDDGVGEHERNWAELDATCKQFAPGRLEFGVDLERTTHLGEIVLARAGEVRGRVVDAHGLSVVDAEVFAQVLSDTQAGFPLAQPLARLEAPGQLRQGVAARVPRVRTRDDGSFAFDALPEGFVRLWATKHMQLAAYSEPLAVRAGEVLDAPLLQLEPPQGDHLIFGRILTPEHTPVAGAIIAQRNTFMAGTSSARSDDDGRFFVSTPQQWANLICIDPQRRWPQLTTNRVPVGPDEVEICFQAWKSLTVRAVDESQRPVEEFSVSVRLAKLKLPTTRPTDEFSTTRTPGSSKGALVVQIPNETFRLLVRAPGFQAVNSGDLEPARAGDALQFEMKRSSGVGGRVFAAGVPVAGARVAVFDLFAEGRYKAIEDIGASPSPLLSRVIRSQSKEQTTTDAAGRFFVGLNSARSLLRIEAAGRAPYLRWSITEPIDDLEVELGLGGSIEGHVAALAGSDPSGLLIGASCGDGHVVTCRTDSAGEYRFQRLSPGAWQVRLLERERAPAKEAPWVVMWTDGFPVEDPSIDCEVFEGQTCHCDLNTDVLERPVLRGQLTIDGVPTGAWHAQLTRSWNDGGSTSSLERWLDPDGRFEFNVAEAGLYGLDLQADPTQYRALHVFERVNLGRGVRTWSADLRTATLVVPADATTSASDMYYAVTQLDAERMCFSPLSIASGDSTSTLVCAGKVRIVRLEDSAGIADSPTVKMINVGAGETIEIRLP